jgi:RNA polymerase-binding transcription factor DksA
MTMSSAARAPAHLPAEATTLLRSLLLCQVAEHMDQANKCRATVDELTGQPDSDSMREREIADISAARFDAAAHEARETLRRLDEGTYGVCERCAAPIPYERLEAIPHARRCVSCPDAPASLVG